MFLPQLRKRPRHGLQQAHAVDIRHRELLFGCDVGLSACAFHGGVNHGQRRAHGDCAAVSGKGGECQCPKPATGNAERF